MPTVRCRDSKLDEMRRAEIQDWFCAFADVDFFRYHVVLTRRCFNLLELFLSWDSSYEEQFSTVMTENALLLRAGEIAEEYVKTQAFPRISIADDLLVHGRNLNRFLKVLFDSVCVHLKKRGILADRSVEADFNKSVTLYIFAVNDTALLLRQEYQWRMCYSHVWPEDMWKQFSFQVSCEILNADLANTSYVLSADIKGLDKMNPTGWIETYNEDHFESYDLYQFFVHNSASRFDCYPSVRVYRKGDHYRLTPYFFVEQIDLERCRFLLDYVRSVCGKAPLDGLLNLIDEAGQLEETEFVFGQFIYFLCSQITLNRFLKDSGLLGKFETEYDFMKIARNFGLNKSGDGEEDRTVWLKELCGIAWPEDVFDRLSEALGLAQKDNRFTSTTGRDVRRLYRRSLESCVYRQAVEHERNAKDSGRICVSGGYIAPETLDSTGESSIMELFGKVAGQSHRALDAEIVISLLPMLTKMMDCGDVSLKVRMTRDKGIRKTVSSFVRNTELSLLIMPRRLEKHYDAVYRTARFFWSEDVFPEVMEQYLTDLLDPSDPETRDYIDDAVEFAKLICSNRIAFGCMLNWKSCLGS